MISTSAVSSPPHLSLTTRPLGCCVSPNSTAAMLLVSKKGNKCLTPCGCIFLIINCKWVEMTHTRMPFCFVLAFHRDFMIETKVHTKGNIWSFLFIVILSLMTTCLPGKNLHFWPAWVFLLDKRGGRTVCGTGPCFWSDVIKGFCLGGTLRHITAALVNWIVRKADRTKGNSETDVPDQQSGT